jgi:uncharacterized protein YdeI (YjbR/CyaY-like superfamily)
METKELPVLAFETAQHFETWMERHHATAPGLMLKFAKKNSGIPSVTYEEALQVALCYGWIDGQLKSLGATHYVQRFTPRRPKSVWSKRNVERVEALLAAGRMKPAGLAEVEAAKSDGRWGRAYDPPSTSVVPPDLEAALKRRPRAQKFFAQLDRTNRYAILHRIQTAVRAETRAARIEKFVAMLERGEIIHETQKTPARVTKDQNSSKSKRRSKATKPVHS